MFKKSLLAASLLAPLAFSSAAFAQAMDGVDPLCIIKNADGTQTVDMKKCPDGKKMAAADATDATKAATDAAKPATGVAAVPDANSATDAKTTGSTTQAKTDIIVSADKMTGAKIISANDFIGKTVYSRSNEKVGKVDDLILSETGVQAVVLGVGGFLGMGTKDVAVMLNSIEIAKDGSGFKLVVDASKDQLKAAPTYDPKGRTYME